MQKFLLSTLLLGSLLIASPLQRARAQAETANATSVIPWFEVKNSAMVVQTGEKIKPLNKDVTLPNGIRVESLTRSIVLTNGTRVRLREGA